MADALVSTLVEKLAAGAIDQVGRALGVRSELESLRSELSAVQAAIHVAEECSATQADVRDWVAKLKDATYDVDDLLDEFQTTDTQWRNHKVRVFFSRSNPLAFRIKMSSKIKAMVEKLDIIAKERSRYNFREVSPSYALQNQTGNRMTAPFIDDETSVYGRDDDVDEILKLLFEKETDKKVHLPIVTIVGMGGLGKTTLAQLVFNHKRVQESFDSRIWVCVSEKFDIMRIAKAIIEFATKEPCNLSELAAVGDRVREILENKRFLLVLDDVWNENEADWDQVKGFLAVGAKGSNIIVTTRSDRVASVMRTTSRYHLGVLSDDAAWRLFEKRAFSSEDIQRDSSLEEIGREIVAKCRGSPLAAKTLGSLMSSKTQKEEWDAVLDSDVWRSTDKENEVMASLKLSYNHLSPDLKQCFAYCCIFPKDTSIKMDELVLHWIAMGFIPFNASLESAINKGKEIFKSLVWISFLDHEDLSKGLYYKMHDLVHDLAKSVAGDEHFLCYANIADQKTTIPQACRFCTLVGFFEESKLKDLFQESRKIRALFVEDTEINTSILFTTLPRLRVLDLGCSPIREVHCSINRLKHLRYFRFLAATNKLPNSIGGLHNLLALDAFRCCRLRSLPQSFTSLHNLHILRLTSCDILLLPESIGYKLAELRILQLSFSSNLRLLPQSLGNLSKLEELDLERCYFIVALPESIGQLANLRTLKLSWCKRLNSLPQSLSNLSKLEELDLESCTGIVELPEGMVNMTSLRHFRNEGMLSLRGMPLGIGKMKRLLTLPLFVVGESLNHSSIVEIQNLNLIDRKLELTHLENVKSPEDAARANMKERHRLQSLRLRWSDSIPYDHLDSIHEEVLVGLIPNPNLEKLEIYGYPGINFPNWVRMMRVSAPNLVDLSLDGLKCLPPFVGGLPPCLKRLEIEGIDAKTNLELSGGGSFPLLQLEELYLSDMPNLEEWLTVVAGVELYPRLVKLTISNCPKMHAEPCISASVKWLSLSADELLSSTGRVFGVDLQDVSCNALEHLFIMHSYKMVDLPESIRRFTSLQSLTIESCPNLAWLPEWLRELTSLKELHIGCSRSLMDQCSGTGVYWPAISHIPKITFW